MQLQSSLTRETNAGTKLTALPCLVHVPGYSKYITAEDKATIATSVITG